MNNTNSSKVEMTSTMVLWVGKRDIKVATLREASDAYSELRKASGEGFSTFPNGVVRDAAGKQVAYVSYNGKVWPPSKRGARVAPLFDPYSETATQWKERREMYGEGAAS